MATQFTIYTASDPNGPGYINGITGSLVTVLDACLVNGYTGKAAAGWTKPISNSGSFYACYKQPSGSLCTLFVNDDGGGSVANGKEATITGWETLTSIFPAVSGSNNVGAGFGQFPLPAQQLTTGKVIVRKSATIDTTLRYWIVAADAYTVYMWIYTGDATYHHWMFGDILSSRTSGDTTKCMIQGRVIQNSGLGQSANNGTQYDYTDIIVPLPAINSTGQYMTVAQPGIYINRNAWGLGTSLNCTKRGDPNWTAGNTTWNAQTPHAAPMYGIMQTPNGTDNQLYMSPIYVIEPQATTGLVRGRMRGLYHSLHHYTALNDGQVLSGSFDYAGKVFTVIRYSYVGSVWLLETSATVEVN